MSTTAELGARRRRRAIQTMPRDYFDILGVSRSADPELIEKAFRILARRHHPDRSGGDAGRFKVIQEAYHVLSSTYLRGQYERSILAEAADRDAGAGADLNLYQMLTLRFDQAARGGPVAVDRAAPDGRRRVEVQVPRAVADGSRLRVPGAGLSDPNGGAAGDLILLVSVSPHERFRREGLDLLVDVDVPVDTAMLGGRASVPTLEGSSEVDVEAGSSGGDRLKVRAAGLSDGRGRHGDLYGVIRIVIPSAVSREARGLATAGPADGGRVAPAKNASRSKPQSAEGATIARSRTEEEKLHLRHRELDERQRDLQERSAELDQWEASNRRGHEALEERIGVFERERAELEARQEQLRRTQNQTAEREEAIENRRGELDEAERALAAEREKIAEDRERLEQWSGDLQRSRSEAEEKTAELTRRREERDRKERALDERRGEIEQREQAVREEAKRLDTDRAGLETAREAIEQEQRRTAERCEAVAAEEKRLRRESGEHQRRRQQLNDHQRQQDAAATRIEKSESRLEEARKAVEAHRADVERASRESDERRERLKTEQKRIETAQQRLHSEEKRLKTEQSRLEETMRRSEADREQLHDQAGRIEADRVTLREGLESLALERQTLERDRESVVAERRRIDEREHEIQRRGHRLDRQRTRLERQVERLKADRQRTRRDRTELDTRRHEQAVRRERLDEERSRFDQRQHAWLDRQERDRSEHSETSDALERERSVLAEQRTRTDERQARLDERDEELAALHERWERHRAELAEREDTLSEQRGELDRREEELSARRHETERASVDLERREKVLNDRLGALDESRGRLDRRAEEADQRQNERERIAEAEHLEAERLRREGAEREKAQAERVQQLEDRERKLRIREKEIEGAAQEAERRTAALAERGARLAEHWAQVEKSREQTEARAAEIDRRRRNLEDRAEQIERMEGGGDRPAAAEPKTSADQSGGLVDPAAPEEGPQPDAAAARASLVLFGVGGERREFEFDQPLTLVGRGSPAYLRIEHEAVSRRHCQIERHAQGTYLRDLDSYNGTYVNGERVSEWKLRSGDIVRVGPVRFVARLGVDPDPLRPIPSLAPGAGEPRIEHGPPSEAPPPESATAPASMGDEEPERAEGAADAGAKPGISRAGNGSPPPGGPPPRFGFAREGNRATLDLAPHHVRTAAGYRDRRGDLHLFTDVVESDRGKENTWDAQVRYYRSTESGWRWVETAARRDERKPARSDGVGAGCYGAASPSVVCAGGRALLFYAGRGGVSPGESPRVLARRGEPGYLSSCIMLASAPVDAAGAPVGPFEDHGRVLGVSEGWDGLRLDYPAAAIDGDVVHLFYTGYDDSRDLGRRQLGHATATLDELSFSREKDPVLRVAGGGEMPRVFRHAGWWHMFYQHFDRTDGTRWRHYVSADLWNWRRHDNQLVEGVDGSRSELMIFTDPAGLLPDDPRALVTATERGVYKLWPYHLRT